VRVASLAATASERRDHVDGALDTATTFFDLAAVARGLVAIEGWDAANEAMRRALEDFVARGYDPALLTDAAVHERYAFPLRPLRQAVDRGDRVTADFWAPWLVVTAAPELPGTGTALRAYADLLAAAGDAEGAAAWRERARAFGPLSAHGVIGNMALGLGRGGWYAAVALLIATLLLHLTLIAKYWRPQTLLLRQAAASGRVGPLPRWRFMRYYGLTEKIALLLLLVAAYAAAALAVWAVSGDMGVRAASAGHLEAPFVGPVITSATADPARLAGLEGYLAWRRGEPERARVAYEQALSLGDPDAGAALDALEAGTRVPAPTRLALREAVSGTWPGAIGRAFVDPFGFVADGVAAPRVPVWAWPLIVGAFLFVGLVHVLALFVPRPRVARNAPRTLAYHVLSVLVPGSGAADELYGVLLLVPAAVFGLDAFMQLVGVGSPLGIPLRTSAWILVMLHAVNLLAFGIEYASYRRRMLDLRREQPDLAHAFGMRELRAEG
jgi:tetratricopeptide (TPR) repeat protein